MNDFTLYNPNRYIFGKSAISHIAEQVAKFGKKVFLTYGGGSIKKNGTYDKVMAQLKDCEVLEFGGIEPNPHVETLRKAIELAREFEPDIILAVGGGSVIDGSKLIAGAIHYSGDAWDIVEKKNITGQKIVPLGCVLTMAATGTEMNGNAVITRWETNDKDYFSGEEYIPAFSIVDPQVMQSLPADQTAYGIVDAYSHVLEQYLTIDISSPIQERFSEGILCTLIEWGPMAVSNLENYEARANIAFAATMALNGLIGVGVSQDWLTHDLEHMYSGLYNIPHGAGLAIIHPRYLATIAVQKKLAKMVQYGKRVFGLTGTDAEIAKNAAQKTFDFFASLGIKMTFTEWGLSPSEVNKIIEKLPNAPSSDIPVADEEMVALLRNCY